MSRVVPYSLRQTLWQRHTKQSQWGHFPWWCLLIWWKSQRPQIHTAVGSTLSAFFFLSSSFFKVFPVLHPLVKSSCELSWLNVISHSAEYLMASFILWVVWVFHHRHAGVRFLSLAAFGTSRPHYSTFQSIRGTGNVWLGSESSPSVFPSDSLSLSLVAHSFSLFPSLSLSLSHAVSFFV